MPIDKELPPRSNYVVCPYCKHPYNNAEKVTHKCCDQLILEELKDIRKALEIAKI